MIAVFHTDCTVWEGAEERGWRLQNEHDEIIRIRAQLLDENMRTVGRFRGIVKPQINPVLSDYTIEKTGITQSMVDHASYFPEVYQLFVEFCDDALVVYTYGKDYNIILANMNLYDACCSNYNFLLRCKDVRPIFFEYGINVHHYTGETLLLAFHDEDHIYDESIGNVESVVRSLRILYNGT